MQKSLVRKGLVFGIIVLFVGASVTPSMGTIISDGNDFVTDIDAFGVSRLSELGINQVKTGSTVTSLFDHGSQSNLVVTDDITSNYKVNGNVASRDQVWLWAKSAGGTNWDRVNGVAVDSSENTFITGFFEGTATFGSITLTGQGGWDVFVAKLDTNGVWQWAKSAGGTNDDAGYGVAVDSGGNVYITGGFNGTATFGSITLTSQGYTDVFVAKMDTNGVWQWAKSAGGTGYDIGYGVAVDSGGNAYITGQFQDIAVFGGTTLTVQGIIDVFVAKMDTNGVWQWAKSAGGTYIDRGWSVAVDSGGNGYITGEFEGWATFGSITLTYYGNNDVFVAKLDTNGVWQWAKSAGGTSIDYGYGVAVDSSGNTYITGYFFGTSSTFGSTTLTSQGSGDVFVAKLDTNGIWQWAKSAGGTDSDNAYGVAVDSGGKAYITGGFSGTATFGSITLTSQGYTDVFVAKMDTNGVWQWAKSAGGTDYDGGRCVAVDSGGNAYITGEFEGAVTFGNTTLTSQGDYDVFVVKLVDGGGIQPDLDCIGTLSWTGVTPGDTVSGSITVENIGDLGSLLDWEVESYPDWGDWSFDPESGTDLLAGETEIIDVDVIAPNEEEQTFTGEVVLVNSEDPDDTCIIDVSLAIPVNQFQSNQQIPRFLQSIIERYPVLRQVLGL